MAPKLFVGAAIWPVRETLKNRHSRAGGTAFLSLNSACAGPKGNNPKPLHSLGFRLRGSDDKWLFQTIFSHCNNMGYGHLFPWLCHGRFAPKQGPRESGLIESDSLKSAPDDAGHGRAAELGRAYFESGHIALASKAL
jgi:hypothetical protein